MYLVNAGLCVIGATTADCVRGSMADAVAAADDDDAMLVESYGSFFTAIVPNVCCGGCFTNFVACGRVIPTRWKRKMIMLLIR